MPALVEICVEGLSSALAAFRGGAGRVELCENLAVGGVTPGLGAVEVACRRSAGVPVHVLIRPRGGDFVYSEAEFEAIRGDVAAAKGAGAAGVVVGVLTPEGSLDVDRMARLVAEARPMAVTFHKAFDAVTDQEVALGALAGLGVDRVLTSGGGPTAREGLDRLARLVRSSAGRVAVMAGGSVREADIPALVAAGLDEIHCGSAATVGGGVDPESVRRLVEAARSAERVIYHVTTPEAWEAARAGGVYRAASLDREGFLHASTAGQVEGTLARFFTDAGRVVLLKIDPSRLECPIRWEISPHSAIPFPHLYGPLGLGAVVEAIPRDLTQDSR